MINLSKIMGAFEEQAGNPEIIALKNGIDSYWDGVMARLESNLSVESLKSLAAVRAEQSQLEDEVLSGVEADLLKGEREDLHVKRLIQSQCIIQLEPGEFAYEKDESSLSPDDRRFIGLEIQVLTILHRLFGGLDEKAGIRIEELPVQELEGRAYEPDLLRVPESCVLMNTIWHLSQNHWVRYSIRIDADYTEMLRKRKRLVEIEQGQIDSLVGGALGSSFQAVYLMPEWDPYVFGFRRKGKWTYVDKLKLDVPEHKWDIQNNFLAVNPDTRFFQHDLTRKLPKELAEAFDLAFYECDYSGSGSCHALGLLRKNGILVTREHRLIEGMLLVAYYPGTDYKVYVKTISSSQ